MRVRHRNFGRFRFIKVGLNTWLAIPNGRIRCSNTLYKFDTLHGRLQNGLKDTKVNFTPVNALTV